MWNSFFQGIEEIFNKAMKYIESLPKELLRQNPYLLAISTYALAMAYSGQRATFMNLLMDVSQKDGGNDIIHLDIDQSLSTNQLAVSRFS